MFSLRPVEVKPVLIFQRYQLMPLKGWKYYGMAHRHNMVQMQLQVL